MATRRTRGSGVAVRALTVDGVLERAGAADARFLACSVFTFGNRGDATRPADGAGGEWRALTGMSSAWRAKTWRRAVVSMAGGHLGPGGGGQCDATALEARAPGSPTGGPAAPREYGNMQV